MNTQIKTITCICGTRCKVGMYKRTCGAIKCTKEWRDITLYRCRNNYLIKKHMKYLFGESLNSN